MLGQHQCWRFVRRWSDGVFAKINDVPHGDDSIAETAAVRPTAAVLSGCSRCDFVIVTYFKSSHVTTGWHWRCDATLKHWTYFRLGCYSLAAGTEFILLHSFCGDAPRWVPLGCHPLLHLGSLAGLKGWWRPRCMALHHFLMQLGYRLKWTGWGLCAASPRLPLSPLPQRRSPLVPVVPCLQMHSRCCHRRLHHLLAQYLLDFEFDYRWNYCFAGWICAESGAVADSRGIGCICPSRSFERRWSVENDCCGRWS